MITAPGKWKVAAYLTAIFAAGIVSGWVISGRHEAKLKPGSQLPPAPAFGRISTNSSIYKVDLTPQQKSRVDAIIAAYGKRMDASREAHLCELRIASSNRNAELSAVLTPEQIQQWEKIRKDRETAWRKGTNSWPGGSNASRGWQPPPPGSAPWDKGDRGDHGPRNRDKRDKRGPDSTNTTGSRDVTAPPAAQSPSPSPSVPER